MKILEENINLGRNCDQFLYTKIQAENYTIRDGGSDNSITDVALRSENFRTALYSYKSNVLMSLGTMINGIMPLNLVPKNNLRQILQEVVLKHHKWRIKANLGYTSP